MIPLAPHQTIEPALMRRGNFWLAGQAATDTQPPTHPGPAYVQWEAPAESEGAPVILIHGGGGQSTDWLLTPDGRPGWAQLLVSAGHPVYLIDRPGHGRSTYLPHVHGPRLPPTGYEGVHAVFVPHEGSSQAERHTAWPWPRTAGHPEIDAVAAAAGPMLADTAAAQAMDRDRVVDLLGRIGPAILVGHSAGAPAAWLAADSVPHLVHAVVAIEPIGPPFKDLGPRGRLQWGPTAAPLTYHPAAATPGELLLQTYQPAPGQLHPRVLQREPARTLTELAKVPTAVVSGEASGRDLDDSYTVGYLQQAGVKATHLVLADHGVTGNGHGLIYEANNDASLRVVLTWLREAVPETTRSTTATVQGQPRGRKNNVSYR
ncbi:pimeloyl-ACP methyl ester carboxylesterase [Arthrobacter bambusae]|uniref:Pimeloyl-ACP methyl ester carboxylesterase n=1 Tax=Arthrobacter bambusae TaxID=1338426 RepID=A0ABV2P234_9MICC